MGNCHPEKTNVDPGEAQVDIGFRGLTISWTMLSSRAVNIYDITLDVNKYIVYITFGYKTIRVK